ncbi:hypothetical protein TURU_005516 [Turdus rufiventris]|nr:hypothetical protein TURU_005516 [Turdus rufiventris]
MKGGTVAELRLPPAIAQLEKRHIVADSILVIEEEVQQRQRIGLKNIKSLRSKIKCEAYFCLLYGFVGKFKYVTPTKVFNFAQRINDQMDHNILHIITGGIAVAYISEFLKLEPLPTATLVNWGAPVDQRLANVTPIYTKGRKESKNNYEPVNLTLVLEQGYGDIILSAITRHMQHPQGIRPSQISL